jgi:hypothetical protein
VEGGRATSRVVRRLGRVRRIRTARVQATLEVRSTAGCAIVGSGGHRTSGLERGIDGRAVVVGFGRRRGRAGGRGQRWGILSSDIRHISSGRVGGRGGHGPRVGRTRCRLDGRWSRLWFEDGIVAQAFSFALLTISTCRMAFVTLCNGNGMSAMMSLDMMCSRRIVVAIMKSVGRLDEFPW